MKNNSKHTVKAAKGEADRSPNAKKAAVTRQSHIGDRNTRQSHTHSSDCDPECSN